MGPNSYELPVGKGFGVYVGKMSSFSREHELLLDIGVRFKMDRVDGRVV